MSREPESSPRAGGQREADEVFGLCEHCGESKVVSAWPMGEPRVRVCLGCGEIRRGSDG